MAYASQSGRARTSSRNPQAFAVCDRCGRWYNHVNLRFQFDWAGASLINKQKLVCQPCYDTPQEQLRAIVIPADPVPIVQPRLEYFVSDEVSPRIVSGDDYIDPIVGIPVYGRRKRITEARNIRVRQETGEPPYGTNQQPGTDPNMPGPVNVPLVFGADPPELDNPIPETGPLP